MDDEGMMKDRVAVLRGVAALMLMGSLSSLTAAEGWWDGYEKSECVVDGRKCQLFAPKEAAPGKPWIWRTEFLGHAPQVDVALLGKGFHVAYMDVSNMYGAPVALDHMDKFHAHLTKEFDLSSKPVLEGLSRGGLLAFNWAARNPDKVAAIYGDLPVCDFKSWPGGKGKGKGSPGDWKRLLKVYGMTEAQAMAYKLNPVDNLAPLAKAKIPILCVAGDADKIVPIDENTQIVEKRYQALGGQIEVILKPGCGHGPHSLPNPTPIVEFVLKHIAAATELSGMQVALQGDARVVSLRCEYQENPLGIDAQTPRLFWKIEGHSERGVRQTAYQVLVALSEERLGRDEADLWDSGKVVSDQSIQVEYGGKPLESRMQCHWKVRVWLSDGRSTAWSQPASWSMGLLKPADWQAKWIKPPGKQTSPWLRKEFTLAAAPERATAFVNVKGLYEFYVNGKKVSDDVLSPAVSVYRKRSLYNTYDISKLLRPGANGVGVWLGLGVNFHGDVVPLARVQLDLSVDGKKVVVGTDTSWTCMPSSHTEFKWAWQGNGRERIDARRDIPDWSKVGCTVGKWAPVEEFTEPMSGVAVAQSCPPNRITKTFPLVTCTALGKDAWELDFGTNLTGWMRLRLPQLEAGHQVTIRFADKRMQTIDGEETPAGHVKSPPGILKIKTPKGPIGYHSYGQESRFTSAGKPDEQFCNRFNYNGFRYAIVEGLPAKPAPGDAEALMIESDLDPVGTFECSNALFNRIHQVNMWTVRCLNLGGYMVDCPHRERLGYGDGQNSIETQIMNLDSAAFYTKWADDWLDEQDPKTGKASQQAPMNRIPDPKNRDKGIQNRTCYIPWGGTVCRLPWQSYLYYGDRRLLDRAYEPMLRYPTVYLESIYHEGGVHQKGGWCGGDWVPARHGMDSGKGRQGTDLFDNCYRVYLYDLIAKAADAIGRTEDAQRHRKRGDELRALIHAKYYQAGQKRYRHDNQASHVLPLLTGVVPDALRGTVQKKLEDLILVTNKGHLDTGMLGTYFLIQYLQQTGRNDLLYTIFNQETYPGWGYMLSQGATTFWEQWNGYWSQIHSCFASADSWFYQGLAGIRPDESGPGFKKIIIKPGVVGDLTWVKCNYNSIHGKIVSNWKRNGSELTMEVTIPANTTATVYVPAKDEAAITESGSPAAKAEGVKFLRMEKGAAVYEVGSGTYRFSSAFKD